MGMLDSVDLSQKLDKDDYKARMEELEINMGQLQRLALDNGVPITILFEGWGASGKGRLINELLQNLDPRGVNVYSTQAPSDEEFLRPFLWRFWTKVPARGRMVIYDRSWYSRFIAEKTDRMMDEMPAEKAYEEGNCFERQLIDDGPIIVKFFLHISREEQKKRFKRLEKNPMTAWRVSSYAWKKHRQYEVYQEVIEEMIDRTDSEYAPWHVVSTQNWRFAAISVFETLIEEVGERLGALKKRAKKEVKPLPPVTRSILATSDLSKELTRAQYDKQRRNYQQRIWELE
ncbi:MAG: phosphate--AMP phosphotransferase, partial [Candidatus Latescibacteria bacterium]|nr:phosphate--AMP phosphotransferase [Candidatus Latescibacterota bacterium]